MKVSESVGELISIPRGVFQRYDDKEDISRINSFYIGKYEITRWQFLKIMGYDPSLEENSSGMNDPVQNINWYEAITFCNKLSIVEKLSQVYEVEGVDFSVITRADIPEGRDDFRWKEIRANWDAAGFRLPTEMEWRWAAMGASKGYGFTSNIYLSGWGKKFSGSNGDNIISDYAWYDENSENKTHPVGTKKPNELGIFDMSGNAEEWCWDFDDTIPSGTLSYYKGPRFGESRLILGGSFDYPEGYCSVKSRNGKRMWQKYSSFGIRVAKNK